MLLDLANSTLRLLLTPPCAACEAVLERPLDSPVCPACWQSVRRPVECEEQPPLLEIVGSAGLYEGALRQIIHAFKYEGRRALAGTLGSMMREAGRAVLADADAVVPVPLHPWRRLSRGFNQADDLARQLGKPVWRVLRRRRHGPPQAGLSASGRRVNVRGAYALRLGSGTGLAFAGKTRPLGVLARARKTRPLAGSVLVLIDDVMTTGATMEACSRVLIDAGASRVRALTVARAEAGRPAPPPLPPGPSRDRRR